MGFDNIYYNQVQRKGGSRYAKKVRKVHEPYNSGNQLSHGDDHTV